jgi:phosphoenolpyruvate-protein kinase (PTS system EI component)
MGRLRSEALSLYRRAVNLAAASIRRGLTTDVGGPLSHGSIVAGEHDIPRRARHGAGHPAHRERELIPVDGNRGVVYLHPEERARNE